MRRLRRLATLPAGDRRLLVGAVLLHTVLRIAVRTLPFGVVRRLVGRVRGIPREFVAPDRIAWAVATATRRTGRGTCLTQALTAHVLLIRHGHEARVRLGVALDAEQRLEAHAWVESAGRPLIGAAPPGRYRPLPDLETARR